MILAGAVMCVGVVSAGCGLGFGMMGGAGDEPTGLAGELAAKAATVADQIGGDDGFGGLLMDDYESHMEDHMGFHGEDDLADDGQMMTVEFHNESDVDAVFHLVYMASHMGIEDQVTDVEVPAGEEVTVELPCSEIMGLGSFTTVGEEAADLADGTTLDNHMSVPGFLGSDYECEDTYSFTLMVDSDDLDGDGDTQELIVVTDGLQLHMGLSGMGGHVHGGMIGGGT
jgi:hypothetical protein